MTRLLFQCQLVTCLLLLPGVTPTPQSEGALKKTRKARSRLRANNNFVVLENYEKDILNRMLARKAKKVGDVVLVNGKPAIIKKRVLKLKNPPVLGENIKKKRIRIKSEVRPTFPSRPRLLQAKSPPLRKVKKLRERKLRAQIGRMN